MVWECEMCRVKWSYVDNGVSSLYRGLGKILGGKKYLFISCSSLHVTRAKFSSMEHCSCQRQ